MSKVFKAAKHTLRALTKTLDDVRKDNRNGDKWAKGADAMFESIQNKYKVDGYDVQGTKAHKSRKDPSDPKDVITIGFFKGAVRLLSGHLHEDGTYNVQESRAGKKSGGSGSRPGSSSGSRPSSSHGKK